MTDDLELMWRTAVAWLGLLEQILEAQLTPQSEGTWPSRELGMVRKPRVFEERPHP